MDGGKGKILRKGCVVKGIEYQQKKIGKKYGTTEDEVVCSPLSLTRSKQGI